MVGQIVVPCVTSFISFSAEKLSNVVMESKQNIQNYITKFQLKSIHDRLLISGHSNDIQKDEIISVLGGIDKILSNSLQSNIPFSQKQLQSLHHIIAQPQLTTINKTSKNIEDKAHEKQLKFTFNDDDILLYKMFTKQTATNIINILNSKITFAILAAITSMTVFTYTLSLLGLPLIYIFTSFCYETSALFLVMIFDAVNIKQSSKLVVSSLAMGIFSRSALRWYQEAFYRDELHIYDQLTMTLPNVFGVGSMTFNIMDITINSAQILSIFLFKQMIQSIIQPKKALVIRHKPLIIYTTKEHLPTMKTVRNWKRMTVFCSVICLLASLALLWVFKNWAWIVIVFAEFTSVCLFMTGKSKYLRIGTIVIVLMIMSYMTIAFLQKLDSIVIALFIIQFGVSAAYVLTDYKFEEVTNMNTSNEKIENQHNKILDVKDISDQQINKICDDDIIEGTVNEMQTISNLKDRIDI
eukprot:439435_1